jgi:thioredoxin 2
MDGSTENGPLLQVACPGCLTANRVLAARTADSPKCGRCATALLDGKPLALDERSFDAFIARTELPIVVDFWAPWCGPCRAMAPAFETAARDLGPSARLVKVDTDASPGLAARFGIRSIPTLILFRAGRESARRSGAIDAGSLTRWVRAQ